jgi:hypothetical protein
MRASVLPASRTEAGGQVTFNRLETEDDVLVLDLNNVTAVDRRVRRK